MFELIKYMKNSTKMRMASELFLLNSSRREGCDLKRGEYIKKDFLLQKSVTNW
jgi:hypothetical protein